jgi:hypothetical protein
MALTSGQRQSGPCLHPRDRLVGIDCRPRPFGSEESPQPLCDRLLGPIQSGQEHAAAAVQQVAHDLSGLQLQRQRRFDQRCRDFEQLAGQRRQLINGQTAVPVIHRFSQRKADAGADPHKRRFLDADLGSDLISGAEPDTADVSGQTVGIFADHPHGVIAVGLVDPHRSGRADAVGVQEQHDLADHFLLRPPGDDAGRSLCADTRHLLQALRVLLDQVEHRLTEFPHQPFGVDRADASDRARGEIPLDALERRWWADLQEGRTELRAVRVVVHPRAADLDELSSGNHRRVANDGDQVPLPPGLHPQHAEPVLRVVERHPLHHAGQSFSDCPGVICHSPALPQNRPVCVYLRHAIWLIIRHRRHTVGLAAL